LQDRKSGGAEELTKMAGEIVKANETLVQKTKEIEETEMKRELALVKADGGRKPNKIALIYRKDCS